MKRIRYVALALVLVTSIGLFGMAQIGVQVSASASQVCGTLYSHDLQVTWKISGATAGLRVAITIGLPDGTSKRSSSDQAEGTISLPLEHPGGGSVSVQLQASSPGATASASASASLSPCAGPPSPSGPNLPELGSHTRDVDNSLQGLLDKIFESRRPPSATQPPPDGANRQTVNPGRASSCLRPVPTPEARGPRAGDPAAGGGQRAAPQRGMVALPPKGHPRDKVSKKPVEGKPLGTIGVKPAPLPSAKPQITQGVARRPKAAGVYTMRAKKKAQMHSASDQLAQFEYTVEFVDEKGNVVAEVPITNISEIPDAIADDEIDLTVDPILEMGPNGEIEEVFYTCIGKKFLVRKSDGTVTVECRGIEVVW